MTEHININDEQNLISLTKAPKIRLENEIILLTRKANFNYTIGLSLVLIGIIVLIFHSMDASLARYTDNNFQVYLLHFLPSFSLAVFAEFFAFVFLRLYKHLQEDIRFYQNEISNIELKTFAMMTALISKDVSLLKSIVEALATTERNFVLKKGETTVGLEREKMDKNEIIDLVRETIISTQRKSK